MKTLNEWIDQRNQLLIEQSLDAGIEELSSKVGSTLPDPDIGVEGKKSWIRKFWDNHKGKIAVGALGAAAIAALYMSGISLLPFGINAGLNAIKTTAKGLSSKEILTQKPLLQAVISDYKKLFVKDSDKWVPIDYKSLADVAANATPDQNGFKIKIFQTPDSRVTNLNNLLQNLKDVGLSDDEIMIPSELFSP